MGTLGVNSTGRRSNVFSARSGGTVSVSGMEVTQAIQNIAHEVRLIAGKRTVVRVYLQPEDLPRNVRVRGEVAIARSQSAPEQYVVSRNIVSLRIHERPYQFATHEVPRRTDSGLS